MPIGAPWSFVPGQSETYTRPLGGQETAFAWDSVQGGVADASNHFVVSSSSNSKLTTWFSEENVQRTWNGVKKCFPLIAAELIEREDASGFDFVVTRDRFNTTYPNEIVFKSAGTEEEVIHMFQGLTNSEPILSSKMLGAIWLVFVPSRTAERPSNVWHVVFHMRHCIMDGMALYAIATAFFDILTSKDIPSRYVPKMSFKDYLNLHLAIDDLNPSRNSTMARLRWRRAIATVIQNRFKTTARGGHTLPQQDIVYSTNRPLISRALGYKCTKETTNRILTTCRESGITLGNAMSVLAQVAHARINHHLRSRGVISDAELEHKIREPSFFGGPVNLRPYLDAEWYNSGGATRGCCAISMYNITLPSMPVARIPINGDVQENPTFDDLFSRKRFLYRCKLSKKQSDLFLSHPLLPEFAELQREMSAARSKNLAGRWRAVSSGQNAKELDGQSITGRAYIMSNGCSTVGNLNSLIPSAYPLNNDSDKAQELPRLVIQEYHSYLRCRPRELYLTAFTFGGILRFGLFVDTTCYDLATVQEWLRYVGEGAEWYLGSGKKSETSVQAKL